MAKQTPLNMITLLPTLTILRTTISLASVLKCGAWSLAMPFTREVPTWLSKSGGEGRDSNPSGETSPPHPRTSRCLCHQQPLRTFCYSNFAFALPDLALPHVLNALGALLESWDSQNSRRSDRTSPVLKTRVHLQPQSVKAECSDIRRGT